MDISGKEKGTVPLIHISGIRVNERKMNSLVGTTPVFSPEENIISFTFTGISFKDEKIYSKPTEAINIVLC